MNEHPRILVVDDHATNRLKLQMAVKRHGYESETAEDGRQALELLGEKKFDLILLDIIMPEMDGYQVLAALKADLQLRDIPVLVISTVEELDAVAKAIEMGAEDHLPKAFDPVLFKARIGACLEKKRMRDLEIEYLNQVQTLTKAATIVESGNYDPTELQLNCVTRRTDALGKLARVFQEMAREVHSREQQLKQQLQFMQIEIDQARQEKRINSITGTDYFKDLRERASGLRAMLHSESDEQQPAKSAPGKAPVITAESDPMIDENAEPGKIDHE